MVPPKRSPESIGVTATLASVRMEQICGRLLGFGSVMLYPLPGCIGKRSLRLRTAFPDQTPAASTYSSPEMSPQFVSAASIRWPLVLQPVTSVDHANSAPPFSNASVNPASSLEGV